MESKTNSKIQVAAQDDDASPITPTSPTNHQQSIPNSPPPSFRSRASSPQSRRLSISSHDLLRSEAERTLADTFDAPSDDESDDENENGDHRQRLMRGNASSGGDEEIDGEDVRPRHIQRRVTELPTFVPTSTAGANVPVYGGGNSVHDGVFANLSAKPTRGEELEEKPPTYEQAAADATPPYWETTILAPGMVSDEVFVDGLPVGSVFSFVWNGMISMSFQLVGFLLTYLLHTTHAAKNGSRAGLGITLVQYGFTMKGASSPSPNPGDPSNGQSDGDFAGGAPPDPNAHDFNPGDVGPDGSMPGGSASGGVGGISTNDWMAYALMVVGWFILIRAVSDFLRARRHEQLVLQSPDRGLGTPVVAEGERPETSV
ncbi:MAG: hypothetical protein M1822_005846 [Bathelium mastoideum]|nr:MAG: hypothetical protein M1822_005846 [Bathelium mastoideum]